MRSFQNQEQILRSAQDDNHGSSPSGDAVRSLRYGRQKHSLRRASVTFPPAFAKTPRTRPQRRRRRRTAGLPRRLPRAFRRRSRVLRPFAEAVPPVEDPQGREAVHGRTESGDPFPGSSHGPCSRSPEPGGEQLSAGNPEGDFPFRHGPSPVLKGGQVLFKDRTSCPWPTGEGGASGRGRQEYQPSREKPAPPLPTGSPPDVRRPVAQGLVDFVPHTGYHRKGTVPDRPDDPLVVEGSEVVPAASAPNQEDALGPFNPSGIREGEQISPGASYPCTWAGTTTRAQEGIRFPATAITSRRAAPVREVTTATFSGNSGKGRLSRTSKSPSASSRCSSSSGPVPRLPAREAPGGGR